MGERVRWAFRKGVSLFFVLMILFSLISRVSVLNDNFREDFGLVSRVSGDAVNSALNDDGFDDSLIRQLEETGFGNVLDSIIDMVLSSGRLVFLYFYADWCHFCKLEKAIIDELEDIYSERVVFIRINEARNKLALEEFGVTGFPTMFLVYGKRGSVYLYLDFRGFKDQASLESAISKIVGGVFHVEDLDGNGWCSSSIGGLFSHESCSFWDCIDACTDKKETNWEDIVKELFWTAIGCLDPSIITNIAGCVKAGLETAGVLEEELAGEINDYISCAFNLYDAAKELAKKVPSKLGCAYDIGHFLADLLGAQQLGECLGECAADPSSYGQVCQPGEQTAACASVSGFIKTQECSSDCEWVYVPGSVRSCGTGQDCVQTASGAECRDHEEEDDEDIDDPDKPPDKPPTDPGGDHPDDNYDVSTLWTTETKYAYTSGSITDDYSGPKIAVLNRGSPTWLMFYLGLIWRGTVSKPPPPPWRMPPTMVSIDLLEDLSPKMFPVLVVSSGGLYGLDASQKFKLNLEKYVKNGGTLIVFTQQQGKDFSVLPGGEVGGFGWIEDESCNLASVAMSAYHPILSGLTTNILDVNVDGFFTKWPRNATILLTRVKNGMPVMILYGYGKGRILASTLYSDLPHRAIISRDEKVILRDLFSWAINSNPILTVTPNIEASVSLNFTNPAIYSPTWPEFHRGDTINIPVNVTNWSEETANKVTFAVIDPLYNYEYVNVSVSIPPKETRLVNLSYKTKTSSRSGVWITFYNLYNETTKVWSGYSGAFLLDITLEQLSKFNLNVVLRNPGRPSFPDTPYTEVIQNRTFMINVLPSETKSVNITFTPNMTGIWTLEYKIKTLEGLTVYSGIEQYAASHYQERPEGWAYRGVDIEFSITSEKEDYQYGTNATFTFHLWNRGDAEKNITVYWSFPHHYWETGDPIYGKPGTTNPGWKKSNLKKTLTLPAHSMISFNYTIPIRAYVVDGLWADFFIDYHGIDITYLGKATRRFFVFLPSQIELDVKTDKREYFKGENVTISFSFKTRYHFLGKVWIAIWHTEDKYGDWITIKTYNLSTPEFFSFNDTVIFSLPKDARPGIYAVLVDVGAPEWIAWSWGLEYYKVVASKSAYFEVPTVRMKFEFDKAWYREGETVGVNLYVNSSLPIPLNEALNVSIPDVSYTNITRIDLRPKQAKTIRYNINLPSSMDAGSYKIIAQLSDITVVSSFTVPKSKIKVYLAKNVFNVGEDVILNIENAGGVRTLYEYNVTVLDSFLKTIIAESGSDLVKAGENSTIRFRFPDGAVKGTYFLVLKLNDAVANQQFMQNFILSINGLNANIISEADKTVYLAGENVTLTTVIENLDGVIENAILEMQISGKERSCVVPHDDLYINEDTVLCPGFYNIKNEGPSYNVITINASNIVFDCNNAILNITSDYEGWTIVNEGHDNVTIKNCIIQNFAGIYLNNVKNNKIVNNKFSAPEYFPTFYYSIGVEYGENNIIAYNEFIDIPGMSLNFANNTIILYNHLLLSEVDLWRSHSSIVMNNTLEDGEIKVERSNNCTVMYNTISLGGITISGSSYYSANYNVVARNTVTGGPGNGIELFTADYNIIAENYVTGKGKSGIYVTDSDFNIIVGNTVDSNGESGIRIESIKWMLSTWWRFPCFNNTVAANTASFNVHGIYLNGETKYSLIANNTLAQNSYGIFLDEMGGYFPAYNAIYHNNFISNNEQVVDENVYPVLKNVYDDGYPSGGNYWSNYAGVDEYRGVYQNETGSDGIGDTPYVINTATQDNYPFMNQNSWEQFNITEIIEKLNISIPTIDFPGPPQNGNILWEKAISVNVTDTLNLSTFVGQLGVTGKLYLTSKLYSSTGQIIAWHISAFYITSSDVYLTLETDKQIYKPNEYININAEVGNLGNTTKTLTLTLKKDETIIQNISFTLNPNQKFTETLTVASSSSFTLEGTVNGFVVKELIRITEPKINLTVFTPEIVGRDPFTVTVEIQNTGEVELNLNVSIDSQTRQITIPPNQTRQIQAELSITRNTTLIVRTSGDVETTVTKEIIFGENASIAIYPENFYIEGIVEVPYEIRNLGLLETTFTASFILNNENITKTVYLPANGNLTDTLTFNLTKGEHLLRYSTPFQQGNVTIQVQTPPKIVLISLPENMSFHLGQKAEMNVAFKNVGGTIGEIEVKLTVPGIAELTNKTWIEPGMEGNVSFNFKVPDDLEEKYYKAIFEIEGEKHEVKFFALGAKVAVHASLDKQLYEEGENATLTLTVENLRDMNLTLFSTVALGDYSIVEYFNLSSYETKELTFSVPVTFDYGKMLYTVYLTSGRALYINALYIYPKPPESAGIILYTDKQVYTIGETVTIYVNVTKQGRLIMTAPNLNINMTISQGVQTFSFKVPKLRSGTYQIKYTFEDYSSSYPIDVIGYSARIIGPELDKTTYSNGDIINLTLIIDVNRNFEGLVKAWVFDPQDNIIGEGSTNHTFTAGENKVKISMILDTNRTGLHAIAYRVYAYGSFIWLASGATYFDAEVPDTTPPRISHVDVTNALDVNRAITENEPIAVYAIVTDNVNVEEVTLYYRKAGEQSYTKIVMTTCPGCIDTYNATIPASQVTTATIEFYINATDGTNYATYPTEKPATNPMVISVNLYPKPVVLNPPTEITENSMKLSWTESTDADFKNYTIYQSNTAGSLGTPIYAITTKSTTSYTVTGLTANTTYYFIIRVYDTGGLYADSNQVSAKTLETQQSQPPAQFPWTPVIIGVVAAALIVVISVVIIRKQERTKK